MFEINTGDAGRSVSQLREADVMDGRHHETLQSRDSCRREPTANHDMRRQVDLYTVSQKVGLFHPTTDDCFSRSCPISVTFDTITE